MIDGTVDCWGENYDGRLGDGTAVSRSTPAPVLGVQSVIALAAGANHGCALIDGGTVKCWGDNGGGQLGDGTVISRPTPMPVSGVTNAVVLESGIFHSCVILADATIRCWGHNSDGQLGTGTTVSPALAPVAAPAVTGVTSLGLGYFHTCAGLVDGTVSCWGRNRDGQLGDGTSASNRVAPMPVPGLSGVTRVFANGNVTCVLLSNQSARCWGANTQSQVGDGPVGAGQRLIPGLVLQ